MINLVKNELFKIFHKKSTYVILIVMFVFVIITNVIYRYMNLNSYNSFYYIEPKEEVESYLNNYDSKTDNLEDYVYYLALNDIYKVLDDYEKGSWQYDFLINDYLDLTYQYYENKYIYLNDDETLLEQMNNILENIKTANWQYFVDAEIKDVESNLSNLQEIIENNNISSKEMVDIKKQIFIDEEVLNLLNYRLNENVSYENGYLNDAINQLSSLLGEVAEYKYGLENQKENYEEAVVDYNINKYILDNKVDTMNSQTLRGVFINFLMNIIF